MPAFLDEYGITIDELPLMLILVRGYPGYLTVPLPRKELFIHLLHFLNGLRREVEHCGDVNLSVFEASTIRHEVKNYNNVVKGLEAKVETHKEAIRATLIHWDAKLAFCADLNEKIAMFLECPTTNALSQLSADLVSAGVKDGQLKHLTIQVQVIERLETKANSIVVPSLNYESLADTIQRAKERTERVKRYVADRRIGSLLQRGAERATSFQARLQPFVDLLVNVTKKVGTIKGLPAA